MNGEQFKKFRKLMGWTQKEAGEKLGVGQSTVSQWETGARAISKSIELLVERLSKEGELIYEWQLPSDCWKCNGEHRRCREGGCGGV